ncbi:MAG: hypothetical protein Q9225_003058 [Loekoesia sp. 1 TL-2023]
MSIIYSADTIRTRKPLHKTWSRVHNGSVHGLDNLPNEILEKIIHNLHGLDDLYAFVSAYPQAWVMYLYNPSAIVFILLQTSNLGNEIQRLLLTSLGLRQCLILHSHNANKCLTDVLEHFERINAPEIKRNLTRLIDRMGPLNFLYEVANISKEIMIAEESLIKTMLTRAHDRIEEARLHQIGNLQVFRAQGSYLLSPTRMEVHRVRRAIWRLWLYFEFFHDPKHMGLNQRIFFNRLAMWELEEMDCAYYHIQHQTNLWRRACPNCCELLIPDALTKHTDGCGWTLVGRKADVPIDTQENPSWDFQSAYTQYRGVMARKAATDDEYVVQTAHDLKSSSVAASGPNNLPHAARSPETTSIDYEVSAGFTYVSMKSKLRRRCMAHWQNRDLPMGCFLDWGYCIWDKERMQAWKLVDNPENGTRGEFEWWTDGKDRAGCCAHCSKNCFPSLPETS